MNTLRDLAIRHNTFGILPTANTSRSYYSDPFEKSMVEFFKSKNFSVANAEDIRKLVSEKVQQYSYWTLGPANPAFKEVSSIQGLTVGKFLGIINEYLESEQYLKDKNLLLFFENLQDKVPELKNFLEQIKDSSGSEKVEKLRLWLQDNNRFFNGIQEIIIDSIEGNRAKLTEIPAEINYFINLQTLTLLNQNIRDIPQELVLPNLTKLELSGNNITDMSLVSQFPSLESIDLSANQIKVIPHGVNLQNLKELDLGGNRIVDMRPVGQFPSLETIDLWGNQIEVIPPGLILPNLKTLNMGKNKIVDMSPVGQFSSLESVDLSGNQVAAVPQGLILLNLKTLNLINNNVHPYHPATLRTQFPALINIYPS